MSEVAVWFEYRYGFRLRPNAFPKPLYQGVLRMDQDAPFQPMQLHINLGGIEDEQAAVIGAYSFKLGDRGVVGDGSFIMPPLRFEPGEAIPLTLIQTRKLPKLRKRADGGEGIDLRVSLSGRKLYSTLAAPAEHGPEPTGPANK